MLRLNYFLLKPRRELSVINSNYQKMLKYTLYFMYYYQNQWNLKPSYKIYFITKFRKEMSLKLKRFLIKKVRTTLLTRNNILNRKIYKNYLRI